MLTPTGGGSAQQGAHGRGGAECPGRPFTGQAGNGEGVFAGKSVLEDRTGQGLQQELRDILGRTRASASEGRDGHHDEARVRILQHRGAEGAVVLTVGDPGVDDDVSACDQTTNLLVRAVVVEVDDHGALRPADVAEEGAVGVAVLSRGSGGGPSAKWVACRGLDFDDITTGVDQQFRAVRAHDPVGKVDDPDSCQRKCAWPLHESLPRRMWAPTSVVSAEAGRVDLRPRDAAEAAHLYNVNVGASRYVRRKDTGCASS